jgi:hypothetical protein
MTRMAMAQGLDVSYGAEAIVVAADIIKRWINPCRRRALTGRRCP